MSFNTTSRSQWLTITSFVPHESRTFKQNEKLLVSLGDPKLLGRQLATAAGRDALQYIDRPTFTSVRTCEMLALYWFSQGDFQRYAMFLGMLHFIHEPDLTC
jgi:hypothetical protein